MPSLTGVVYLLHFSTPYKHAAHYLGFSTDLPTRLAEHAAGQGAQLTQVVKQARIGWSLTRSGRSRAGTGCGSGRGRGSWRC